MVCVFLWEMCENWSVCNSVWMCNSVWHTLTFTVYAFMISMVVFQATVLCDFLWRASLVPSFCKFWFISLVELDLSELGASFQAGALLCGDVFVGNPRPCICCRLYRWKYYILNYFYESRTQIYPHIGAGLNGRSVWLPYILAFYICPR